MLVIKKNIKIGRKKRHYIQKNKNNNYKRLLVRNYITQKGKKSLNYWKKKNSLMRILYRERISFRYESEIKVSWKEPLPAHLLGGLEHSRFCRL